MTSASELAPQEDQGIVLSQVIGPPNATFQQMQKYAELVFDAAHKLPEFDSSFPDHGYAGRQPGLRRHDHVVLGEAAPLRG